MRAKSYNSTTLLVVEEYAVEEDTFCRAVVHTVRKRLFYSVWGAGLFITYTTTLLVVEEYAVECGVVTDWGGSNLCGFIIMHSE